MSSALIAALEDIPAGISLITTLLTQVEADAVTFAAGQPVQVPTIKTYIAGKHVQINLTVQQLPS